jgi:hypothetical protein
MGNQYQQQSLQRKVLYLGLILVLFTGAWVWRHKVVDVQAADLAVREQSRGEVEISGAFVRLSLMGLRGVATCVLWSNAQEKQARNQWNELELLVRSLTKLQPHFITPWLFQSWNLAYNVSVESDRVNDKYFYITRGIGLLAEGERQNRDNPDIRWSIGFYTQHKLGQSDETNTLRSMEQLSAIPPNERDPARFRVSRAGRVDVNWVELEKFCRDHPQLARRLREGMRQAVGGREQMEREKRRQFKCETAEDVVRFLEDNYRLPGLYEEVPAAPVGGWQQKADRLKASAVERFPVLPPDHTVQPPQHKFDDRVLTSTSILRDEDDLFQVARAWYCYAQEPIPDPGPLPGSNEPIKDRTRQHVPRYMATLLFRSYPAHAQRFTAERLQEEGWFDESGWEVRDWFRDRDDDVQNDRAPSVGGGRKWSQDAWQLAADAWRRHGENNHLMFKNEAAEENMRQLANEFRQKHNLPPESPAPGWREEDLKDEADREGLRAVRFLTDYGSYRAMSNFAHQYHRALVEAKEETVKARKLFYEAESLWLAGASPDRVLAKFNDPDCLAAWRDKVLLGNKDFRRDSFTQEQSCEMQLKYLEVCNQAHGPQLNAQTAALAGLMHPLPGGGVCPLPLAVWVPLQLVHPEKHKDGTALVPNKDWSNPLLGGPFDRQDDEGVPFITAMVRQQVAQRLAPVKNRPGATRPPVPPAGGQPAPGMPPG